MPQKHPYQSRIQQHQSKGENIVIHRRESLALGGTVIESDDDGFVLQENETEPSEIFVAYESVCGIRIKAANKKP